MADVPGAEGAQAATGGIKGTLTRKVGPLPLWAYAVIGGGLILAVRLYTGGGAAQARGVPDIFTADKSGTGADKDKPDTSGSPVVGGIVMPETATIVPTTRRISAAPVSVPSLTVDAAPVTPGAITKLSSPLRTSATKTTGQGVFPANAFIQYVDGVPISLSNFSVVRGGITEFGKQGSNLIAQYGTQGLLPTGGPGG